MFYIDRFLTWLQDKRYVRVENEYMAQERNIKDPKANEPIGTEDLVHFINATLSPAASYIVCTGNVRPGNFSEKLVQRRKMRNEDRDAFFLEKEGALVSFFANNPNNYKLVENGRDLQNRVLYTVKKMTIIIVDSDESDSDLDVGSDECIERHEIEPGSSRHVWKKIFANQAEVKLFRTTAKLS